MVGPSVRRMDGNLFFLDASLHLYKRPCPPVGWSVRWSVGPSVTLLSKSMKNGLLLILSVETVLDEAERRTRRKEGRGGRRSEEEGATRRKERRRE